jgi:hypothetical protein
LRPIWGATITKFAIPELERLSGRRAIVDAWLQAPKPPWFGGSRMVLAALLAEVGRTSEAIEVARAEAADSVGRPSEEWAKAVAQRLSEIS